MISPAKHNIFQCIVNNPVTASSNLPNLTISPPTVPASPISPTPTSPTTPTNTTPLTSTATMINTTKMNSKCKSNKKQRKQRTVKNAYIDISDVNEESGSNYNKWISISKEKLKVL